MTKEKEKKTHRVSIDLTRKEYQVLMHDAARSKKNKTKSVRNHVRQIVSKRIERAKKKQLTLSAD